MDSVLRHCRNTLAVFFAWWAKELQNCIPVSIQTFLRIRRARLLFEMGGTSVTVRQGEAGEAEVLGSFDLAELDTSERRHVFQQAAAAARPDTAQSVFCLPSSEVLRCTISLPIEAQDDLRDVLTFEMDRHTPCRSDEVLFDFRVLSKDPDNRLITVDLAYARKACVERALALASDLGVEPARVIGIDQADEGGNWPNLISSLEGRKHQASGRKLSLALVVLAGVLSGAAIYLPWHEKQARLTTLEQRLETAKSQASQVAALTREAEVLIASDEFLIGKLQRSPRVIDLLGEISRLLPDDTWVFQVSWASPKIAVSGYSAEPSELIPLLEASRLVDEPRFSSTMTHDVATGLERFNLQAVAKAAEQR